MMRNRSTAVSDDACLKDQNNPVASIRWRWMIEGDWKLILPDTHNQPDDAIELYNLSKDPHEESNVAGSLGTVVEKMREKINAWWPGDASGSTR